MYAIAIIRDRRPLVLRALDAHRACLAGLRQRGRLLASDPFVRQGIAQDERQLRALTIGREDLDRIATVG